MMRSFLGPRFASHLFFPCFPSPPLPLMPSFFYSLCLFLLPPRLFILPSLLFPAGPMMFGLLLLFGKDRNFGVNIHFSLKFQSNKFCFQDSMICFRAVTLLSTLRKLEKLYVLLFFFMHYMYVSLKSFSDQLIFCNRPTLIHFFFLTPVSYWSQNITSWK